MILSMILNKCINFIACMLSSLDSIMIFSQKDDNSVSLVNLRGEITSRNKRMKSIFNALSHVLISSPTRKQHATIPISDCTISPNICPELAGIRLPSRRLCPAWSVACMHTVMLADKLDASFAWYTSKSILVMLMRYRGIFVNMIININFNFFPLDD